MNRINPAPAARSLVATIAVAASVAFAAPAHAQLATVLTRPAPVLPSGDANVARVVKISFGPGAASQWHLHPYPIYVYVVQGSVGLEFRGQSQQAFSAGQGWHEPANAVNRVVNLSKTEPLDLVMFQISEAAAPFNRPAQGD